MPSPRHFVTALLLGLALLLPTTSHAQSPVQRILDTVLGRSNPTTSQGTSDTQDKAKDTESSKGSDEENTESEGSGDKEAEAEDSDDKDSDDKDSDDKDSDARSGTTTANPSEPAGQGSNLSNPSSVAETLWEFPIIQMGVEDDGAATYVRLGNLLLALLVFVAIVIGGRWLFRRGVIRPLRKVASARTALLTERVAFLVLLVLGMALAMIVGRLPLSFLAVLSALLLVGLAFGAKKLLNNVVSGYVTAVEGIVNEGDCIELDGHHGYVLGVHSRHTRIRGFDGIDVLLPNSRLTESKVINWTRHDKQIRGELMLSVVYGSDVERVIDIIHTQCEDIDAILAEPAPVVLLWEFAKNGLCFRVFFWTEVGKPTELWLIQSDLRLRVERAFRDHEVAFAFPQRVLHMDGGEGDAPEERMTQRHQDMSDDPEADDAISGADVNEANEDDDVGTNVEDKDADAA